MREEFSFCINQQLRTNKPKRSFL